MKNLIFILLILSFMGCRTSQIAKKDFTQFYNTYEDDKGVVSFQVPIALARMIIKDKDHDADNFIKKLDKIRFFIKNHDNGTYKKEVQRYLPNSVYNDIMVIKNNESTVIFKMKEPTKGHTREIVMTVTDPDSFVAVSFTGDFNLEDAKQVTSSIKTNNFANMNFNLEN